MMAQYAMMYRWSLLTEIMLRKLVWCAEQYIFIPNEYVYAVMMTFLWQANVAISIWLVWLKSPWPQMWQADYNKERDGGVWCLCVCALAEMCKSTHRLQPIQNTLKLMYPLCKVLYAEYIHTCIWLRLILSGGEKKGGVGTEVVEDVNWQCPKVTDLLLCLFFSFHTYTHKHTVTCWWQHEIYY